MAEGCPCAVHIFSLRSEVSAYSEWSDYNLVVRSEACLVFLQSLLEKGLAFSTVKVYAELVSAGHEGCDG